MPTKVHPKHTERCSAKHGRDTYVNMVDRRLHCASCGCDLEPDDKITTYEVCAECRAATVNCDPSCFNHHSADQSHNRYDRWVEFTALGYFSPSDDAALGDSCECCGYSDYDGEFFVLNCEER